jgi:hypothetical protein
MEDKAMIYRVSILFVTMLLIFMSSVTGCANESEPIKPVHSTEATPQIQASTQVSPTNNGSANQTFPSSSPECTPPKWCRPTPIVGAQPPTWYGIVLGKTTERELASLMPAYQLRRIGLDEHENRKFWYKIAYYEVGTDDVRIWIRYSTENQDEPIDFIEIFVFALADHPGLELVDIVRKHGKPELIVPKALNQRTYIYASKGMAFNAAWTDKGAKVWSMEYFAPVSVNDYLMSWGRLRPRVRSPEDNLPLDLLDIK